MRGRGRGDRRRHVRRSVVFPCRAARRRRRLRDDPRAARRRGQRGLLWRASLRAPCGGGSRDGLLPVRQRRDRRRSGDRRARAAAGVHPRLGRPPRQRHRRDLPRTRRRAVREHPPDAAVSGQRPARGRRLGRRRGLHDQPSGGAGIGRASRGWRCSSRWCCRPPSRSSPSSCSSRPGFDAHAQDPLAECRLQTGSFVEIAARVRGLADDAGIPLGVVLEGGYNRDVLAECVCATLPALAGQTRAAVAPQPPARDGTPTARAVAFHRSHWPI